MKKIVKLISIIFLVFFISGCGEKEQEPIIFEDYIYNQVMDVDTEVKFNITQKGSIQLYNVKATFIGLEGESSFERGINPKKFIKNGFITELQTDMTLKDLEAKIESVMTKVKTYTKIEDVKISMKQVADKKLNHDDSILQNLVDDTGIICFNLSDKNRSYEVLIYNENNKILMSIGYIGLPSATTEE